MPIAMVTGASSGIGSAVVRDLVRRGFRVIAAARRHEMLDALASELGPANVLAFPLDVRDRDAVRLLPDALPRDFAEIDLLVNNAGLALGMDGADTANLDDWLRMIDTNVTGLTMLTRVILPGMVARRRGHVIQLGSVAATCPYPGGNVYGATKAFVRQLSANLRSDLHGSGVRVTCIEPGMVEGTEFSEVRFGGDRARAQAVYARTTPLRPEDIAEAVGFCATLPAHVNVSVLEIMPTAQSLAGFQVHRTP